MSQARAGPMSSSDDVLTAAKRSLHRVRDNPCPGGERAMLLGAVAVAVTFAVGRLIGAAA